MSITATSRPHGSQWLHSYRTFSVPSFSWSVLESCKHRRRCIEHYQNYRSWGYRLFGIFVAQVYVYWTTYDDPRALKSLVFTVLCVNDKISLRFKPLIYFQRFRMFAHGNGAACFVHLLCHRHHGPSSSCEDYMVSSPSHHMMSARY